MSNRCLVVPKWAEVLEIEGRGRLGVDPKYGNFCSGVRRGLFSESALFEPGFVALIPSTEGGPGT
jgi:hypothetical protein